MSTIFKHAIKCFAYVTLLIELSKGRQVTGYDILIKLRELGVEVSPGTVYNQLSILERDGNIESESVKRVRASKTVYRMTEKGFEHLKEFKDIFAGPLGYIYQNLREQYQD